MATRTDRRLGSFERAQALTAERFAFNLVVVVRVAGTLGRETLRSALDAIQQRHALLRASLVGSGRSRRFELGEARSIPLRGVERRGEGAWQEVVEDELAAPFEASGPFLRCARVARAGSTEGNGGTGHWGTGSRGTASELVLTFHHVIVDAVSARHLVHELLDECSGVVHSSDARRPRHQQSLPPHADELFPPAFRAPRRWPASARFLAGQLADEAVYRWRARDRSGPSSDGAFRCRVLSLALGEAETTALVRATRRHRVGLFGALSAAMLLAVVRLRHGNRPGPHRYFAFPLLRPYLSPPVPDDVVAGYLTTLRLTLPVMPDSGVWPTAERIHRRTDAAVKRGDRFLASLWSAFSMATILRQRSQRMGTTALNYAGATPLRIGDGAPFSVTGFHAFVGNFPLGPEYTAQARIFERRLWWDVVYLDVDMERDEALAIAEEMRRLLAEAVG